MIYCTTTSKQDSVYSLKNLVGITLSIGMALNVAQAGPDNSYSLIQAKSNHVISDTGISSEESAYNTYNSYVFVDGEHSNLNESSRMNNHKIIDEIQKLQDNWNDNGAAAFSESHIIRARAIIDLLYIQPFVFPTANDSIQFEYEKNNGDYLEFELYEDGKIKMFFYGSNGSNKLEYVNIDSICKVVEEFYGNNL